MLSPLFSLRKTPTGKVETDSDNNLIAAQTAVKVNAFLESTCVDAPNVNG